MFSVSFIIAFVLLLIGLLLFCLGLIRLYRDKPVAKGLITSGYIFGLVGVIAPAVIFGFFNI